MNIIFFGNTKYSTLGANIIHEKLGLSHIVTIPDKLSNKKILTPSPTKKFALTHSILVFTTPKLDENAISYLQTLKPDFFIVEDYRLILPKKLLSLPRYANLNIHHSLLPKYRGPSPAPAAILAGEKTSGVTIIQMTEKVDAGDILAQQEYSLTPNETTDSLLTQLNSIGANLMVSVINNYLNGNIQPKKQDETKATYTKMLTKQDGYFDLNNPPMKEKLDRMIRAFHPWPGVWTKIRIRNLPTLQERYPVSDDIGNESRIKFLPENKIQVEGGKPMTIKDFLNGYPELKSTLEKFF